MIRLAANGGVVRDSAWDDCQAGKKAYADYFNDDYNGGGIWQKSGHLTIEHSRLTGNYADNGGAIAAFGRLACFRCTLTGNGGNNGGAISAASASIIDSSLVGNYGFFGGAISAETLELLGSTVAHNWAGYAGGLYISGNLLIDRSTFFDNHYDESYGEHIYHQGGAFSIRHSTFSGGGDSGIMSDSSFTVENSIVNTGCACTGWENSVLDSTNCACTVSGSGNVMYPERCGNAGGVVADPLLAPLANNGGPTQTMLPRAGSPAIDRIAQPCGGVDQRGVARPQGNGCDAGAVEIETVPLLRLIAPVGRLTDTFGNPIYQWTPVGAAFYDLTVTMLYPDHGRTMFTARYLTAAAHCIGDVCGVDATTLPGIGEQARLPNGIYQTHLRAAGGEWIGPFTFEITTPPPDPVTFYPPSELNTPRPTLHWTLPGNAAYATWFRLFIRVRDNGAQVLDMWYPRQYVCGTITGTNCTLRVPLDLVEDTSYYAFMQSYGPGGYSVGGPQYGNGWAGVEFTVNALADTPLPTGLTVTLHQGHPTIAWVSDPLVEQYHVAIYHWTTNTWVYDGWHLQSEKCVPEGCVVTPELPLANGSYSVFVGALGPNGMSRGGPFNNGYIGPTDPNNLGEAGDFVIDLPMPPLVDGLSAALNDTTLQATWQTPTGATWYQVWVGTAGATETYYLQWHSSLALGCVETAQECRLALPLQLTPGTYYVAVQSAGPGGWQTTGGLVDNGFQVSDPVTMP